MTAASATATIHPIEPDPYNRERAELLDLLQRAEKRLVSLRNEAGAAFAETGALAPRTFDEKVTGPGGGLLAAHYAATVIDLARNALTIHTAGSLELHLLGFAESIARSVLNEYRGEVHA